jgi:hypothetical protein
MPTTGESKIEPVPINGRTGYTLSYIRAVTFKDSLPDIGISGL